MPTPTNPQPQPHPQPQPLIWINGFPGTGKLTVATILQVLLHSRKADTILLHNHLLIDPVEARFPRDHPDYQKERKLYRRRIFEEFVYDRAKVGRVVIFTDYQSDNELGRAVAMEYRDAARKAQRPFLPIYFICDVEENVQRIASREIEIKLKFNGWRTGKLTDVELLRDFRTRCQLLEFGDCGGLTIDTTNISPEEAAERILAFVMEFTEFKSK